MARTTSYPQQAGWKDTTVSKENADAMNRSGRTSTLRQRVLELFRSGFSGTADEVAGALNETPFAIRPRVTELLKLGEVERYYRRPSGEGKTAWVVGMKGSISPTDAYLRASKGE